MAWRLQRTRQAVLPGKCAQGLCVTSVHYCADVEASAPKNETRDAGWKPCKGAKGVWRHLEGGYLRVSAATVRVSKGFQGFPEGFWQAAETVPQNAVWIGVRRLCHAAKTKKEYKGSGAYMNQVQRFSRGISGLVVEYIVAIWPGFDSRLMHIVLMSRWERVRWRGEGAQEAETDSHMTAWTEIQLTCRFCRRHFGRAAKASAC